VASDGQIVFEITADGKKAVASVQDVTRAIETETKKWDASAGNASKNMESSFTAAIGKIGAAMGAAKIGQLLMDFGKQGVANEGIFVYMTGATDINGGILLLTFKVKNDAPIGNTQVSCEALNFKDASGVVSVLSVSGTVSVSCPHTNAYAKNEIPSTCKEQGYAAGVYCDDCDTYIAGGERLPEVAHTYEGENNGWAYSGPDEHERVCIVCQQSEREMHDYGDWYPNPSGNWHDKICVCGHGQSGYHVFDAQVVTNEYLASEADCYNAATYYYSCSECGLADTTTFTD
jgi:hypothetical protein